ncbi:unnamed protein product [Prorocentrum cordatum]|uniref:Uncharacterized protein n=1 Tax=Prorocentrum cordatum TaxID=2364126 RepID=A0ABN9R156_9DINO|nr:unnamed protein product [Polarella glacialis]
MLPPGAPPARPPARAPGRGSPTAGEVLRSLPRPEELEGLVRYKGPASQREVLRQAATNSELQRAVEKGDAERVAAILRYGARGRCVNVNAPLWPTRERVLHLAARGDRRDICVLLLEARAELDCEEITDGKHPLHEACCTGSCSAVELLLDRRARLEEANFTGMRPLHWAAAAGHAGVVDLLLDRRAQCDARSGNTWAPLHHAAAAGHAASVRLLCGRGGAVDAECSGGRRPAHVACQAGHLEAAAALLDHEAGGPKLGP